MQQFPPNPIRVLLIIEDDVISWIERIGHIKDDEGVEGAHDHVSSVLIYVNTFDADLNVSVSLDGPETILDIRSELLSGLNVHGRARNRKRSVITAAGLIEAGLACRAVI